MKKTILITLLAFFSVVCMGQNEGTLKFLGIPVDGTEAQFAEKLKQKGFTYDSFSKSYRGQFNGEHVDVYIHTNHNLVDRVYVAFLYTTEEQIRIRYNRLLSQFEDKVKYIGLSFNEEIPAGEDISYEINVKKKRYQASFSYFDSDRDPFEVMFTVCKQLITPEQSAEFTAAINTIMEVPEAERMEILTNIANGVKLEFQQMGDAEQEKAERLLLSLMDGMKSLADGEVWFTIHEEYGKYRIGLYYDNLRNQAHGEDL